MHRIRLLDQDVRESTLNLCLQVFGGLIVAMVVKHADNILKNFANALAVIFTVLGSIPIFGQYPSYWFLLGALLVSLSVALYGTTPEQSAQYCDAIGVFFKEPVWMHTFRTQPSVQLRRARCESQVAVVQGAGPTHCGSISAVASVGIRFAASNAPYLRRFTQE